MHTNLHTNELSLYLIGVPSEFDSECFYFYFGKVILTAFRHNLSSVPQLLTLLSSQVKSPLFILLFIQHQDDNN